MNKDRDTFPELDPYDPDFDPIAAQKWIDTLIIDDDRDGIEFVNDDDDEFDPVIAYNIGYESTDDLCPFETGTAAADAWGQGVDESDIDAGQRGELPDRYRFPD